ncbi:hypothetical protein [Aureimonas psammosilenae]|uniref:hypothetical protein n=1 Tax=Aureimonas psammosilenae TaxID=2495496 RepID=UPI002E2725C2
MVNTDADDHPIEQSAASAQNIEMTEREGIERARIKTGAHGHGVMPVSDIRKIFIMLDNPGSTLRVVLMRSAALLQGTASRPCDDRDIL